MINPFLPWFTLTVLAIALVSALLTARATETFRARPLPVPAFLGKVIVCGVVTGIVSAIVSAPVVVYLFGGVTGSGSAFVVAFFLKTGQQLLEVGAVRRLRHRADRQDPAGAARRPALSRDAARIHRHAARRHEPGEHDAERRGRLRAS